MSVYCSTPPIPFRGSVSRSSKLPRSLRRYIFSLAYRYEVEQDKVSKKKLWVTRLEREICNYPAVIFVPPFNNDLFKNVFSPKILYYCFELSRKKAQVNTFQIEEVIQKEKPYFLTQLVSVQDIPEVIILPKQSDNHSIVIWLTFVIQKHVYGKHAWFWSKCWKFSNLTH